MFDGRLPSFANTRSMRVAGGLGTVARVVGDAQEIYSQRIPVDDAIRRMQEIPGIVVEVVDDERVGDDDRVLHAGRRP